MALQESPSLNQTHHLFSDTTKALSLWTFVLRDILYVECLPSPSTVRQEWSGFHFLLKGSAKLRSPEPPQAGGWASLPPQVTLRLGNFKNRKCPISTRAILRSTSLFWLLFFFTFLKGTRLELVTSNLVRFLIRSSCSRWSWSFSCSSWERTFFSVAAVWVTEETWEWEHQTCDHMTWYYAIWPRKTGRNNNTDLVKAPLEINYFISIPFEQCSIIRHLCHVRIILHLLCSAGKLKLEFFFFLKESITKITEKNISNNIWTDLQSAKRFI